MSSAEEKLYEFSDAVKREVSIVSINLTVRPPVVCHLPDTYNGLYNLPCRYEHIAYTVHTWYRDCVVIYTCIRAYDMAMHWTGAWLLVPLLVPAWGACSTFAMLYPPSAISG